MKTQFLLHIDFLRDGYYTLVGGIKTTSISIDKKPVETENFSKHWRVLLEKSGVTSVNINSSCVLDPDLPKKLFDKLTTATTEGNFLKVRVSNDFKTIEGLFRIEMSFADSYDQSTDFDLILTSSNEISIK